MIKFKVKKEEVEHEIPTHMICDVCKNEFSYDIIEDQMLIQEFHHIRFTGGYASIFGDMVTMKADICQHCLDKKLGEFLIVEEEENE